MKSHVFAAQTEVWVHWSEDVVSNSGLDVEHVALVNSTGQTVFKMCLNASRRSSGGNLLPKFWNGSTFTTVGSGLVLPAVRYDYDLHVICGASGSFELFQNGSLVLSGACADADFNNVAEVWWGSGLIAGFSR